MASPVKGHSARVRIARDQHHLAGLSEAAEMVSSHTVQQSGHLPRLAAGPLKAGGATEELGFLNFIVMNLSFDSHVSSVATKLDGAVVGTLVFKKCLAALAISFDLGPVINCHVSYKICQQASS